MDYNGEQQIWSVLTKNPYFWSGHWEHIGTDQVMFIPHLQPEELEYFRLDEHWNLIKAVAVGSRSPEDLPEAATIRRGTRDSVVVARWSEPTANGAGCGSMTKRFQRLTRSAIRSLPPGSSITEAGIRFQRLPNGDGVFSVNIMVDRVRVHRVIGRESEGVTRQQAEDFIARARTDARRERLDLPEARKTQLAFTEASTRYLERLRVEGGKNIPAKDRQLRMWLLPFFGRFALKSISSTDVERYKTSRLGFGTAPATINRELAVCLICLEKRRSGAG